MPIGLSLNDPSVDHRCVYSDEARTAICAFKFDQPPASISPITGITSAPAQIRMNCSTSLKMAERKPPSATYTATVTDDTQMLKLMSQPSTTFITSAIEYMLMPLISTVMKANETDDKVRADSPKRSLRYPGTECVLEM